MKLIITSAELNKEFISLAKYYKNYYWTIAWAGGNNYQIDILKENKKKIKKIIVGLHFYQTHPDFIETFLKDNSVKYIKQPSGTFHPKMYLFYNNDNDWAALIGSANFTNEAFSKNTEATILIQNDDNLETNVLKSAFALIDSCWEKSSHFSYEEFENYRKIWKNLRPKLKSLAGIYGDKNLNEVHPVHDAPVISMNWEEFVQKVNAEPYHGVNRRLEVLQIAKELFSQVEHFSDIPTEERKFIAGIPNNSHIVGAKYWPYFGSMKGAGIFKRKIIENEQNISLALDEIPLTGQITKSQYLKFKNLYFRVFPGNYIATATRLLAMKRPDTFYCLTSKNRNNLIKAFGLKYNYINYERYWDDIIERIYDSEWWLNPNPIDLTERKISEARAAFLDSIYYKE